MPAASEWLRDALEAMAWVAAWPLWGLVDQKSWKYVRRQGSLKAAPEILHARRTISQGPLDPHPTALTSRPDICDQHWVRIGRPACRGRRKGTSHQRHANSPGLCSRAISDAEQQAIDADIFVQALPMEPAAASADDVRLALFIIRLEKPREVSEWDRKLATISKEHPQIVRVEP